MREVDWIHFGKILGNTTRLRILCLLWGSDETTVTDIAEELGVPVKSASQNLIQMERKGILIATGKNSRMFYCIAPDLDIAVADVLQRIMVDLS